MPEWPIRGGGTDLRVGPIRADNQWRPTMELYSEYTLYRHSPEKYSGIWSIVRARVQDEDMGHQLPILYRIL